MKRKFKIEYRNPETREVETVYQEFEGSDDPAITAKEWAEDAAYSYADKGWYSVTEVRQRA